MNCLVRFCKSEKKSLKIKYQDIEEKGAVLRTIYKSEKCGRFLEKRIARLCRGCQMAEDNSLWLALQNMEGIIKKLGKCELIIFIGEYDKISFDKLLENKNNISILTDDENLEALSEKVLSQSGAACVYSYESFTGFENKNIIILPGFSGEIPQNAKKIINLSGQKLNCKKEILPQNIIYQVPKELQNAASVWGKDAKTLSALIKFYNLPAENLNIFSL